MKVFIKSLQYFSEIFSTIEEVVERRGKMGSIWEWLTSTKLFENGELNWSVLKELIAFLF